MPSKTTPQDLKDLQFVVEQFNAVLDFDAFLQGVIDVQEPVLSARVGSFVFDSADAVIANQVKRAALCLCAAELLQRRINRLSGNVDADTALLIRTLQDVRHEYLTELEDKITRVLTSGTAADSAGYAGGVVTTSGADEGIVPLWPVTGTV